MEHSDPPTASGIPDAVIVDCRIVVITPESGAPAAPGDRMTEQPTETGGPGIYQPAEKLVVPAIVVVEPFSLAEPLASMLTLAAFRVAVDAASSVSEPFALMEMSDADSMLIAPSPSTVSLVDPISMVTLSSVTVSLLPFGSLISSRRVPSESGTS